MTTFDPAKVYLFDRDGPGFSPFKTWHNPPTLTPADAHHLHDASEVLAVDINGQARAYPVMTVSPHHIVQDTVGGKPVAITF